MSLRFTVTTNQSFGESKFLGNRSFWENLRRLAKIIWGGDTVSIFEKQVGGVTTRI